MEKTCTIRMRVTEKTESQHWAAKGDGAKPMMNKILMHTSPSTGPEDPNAPYANLSPGSEFKLATINESSSEMFVPGCDYEITIKKV